MAIYAVGDIQGCYKPLKQLLKKVDFNPKKDVLWCCGDMVNRGADSLKVLRFLKGLGDACVCVLGNHDIQLLAYAAGGKAFKGDTLDDVLQASDSRELIDWLRFRPMLHHDDKLGWCMVHAGLSPLWSLKKAKKRARKVEKILRSDDWADFCLTLQEKSFPEYEPHQKAERYVFSPAVFTRTRYCTAKGVFDWKSKTSDAPHGDMKPWFSHRKAKWKKDCRVVYGHWAAKGLVADESHVLGLDTGCVWGGKLTLARLDGGKVMRFYVAPCEACLEAA